MGDRRVWVAGGAVLAVVLVAILASLLDSEEVMTGHNSVGARADVAAVQKGQRLCVPGLTVPSGTGQVRFAASWQGARSPGFDVELTGRGWSRSGDVPAAPGTAGVPAAGRVDVPVEVIDRAPATDSARLCITPREGAAGVGGTPGLQGDQRPATLDGSDVDARVAVWFLAPEEDEATPLSQLPEAFERAALFRPGVVGPWLYVLMFLVAIPLLWLVSIRLMATASLEKPGRRTALVIAAVAIINAGVWALVTPAWQGPDEPDHFAFSQSLAERGEAPGKPGSPEPPYSSGATLAFDATRTYSQVGLAGAKPPWLESDERRYRDALAAADSVPEDNGGGFLFPSSPHSPAYYGLVLPGYSALDSQSVFSQLTAMRLMSALLAGLAAACAFLTVRELAPRLPWLAVTAGLLMAFQPMAAFMFGIVNSDAGVNALAALLIYLLIRGLRRGLTVPMGAALGAALIALPAMKGTGFALYPAAAIGLAGMAWRRHARSDLPGYAAVAGAGAVIAAIWVAATNALQTKPFTTPGGGAGAGLSGTVERVLDQPGGFVSYTWQMFMPRLPFMADLHAQRWPAYDVYIQGGWAAFGWLTVRFPPWVYLVIVGLSLIVAALCVVAVAREWGAARRLGWELAVLLAVIGGVIGGVEAAHFTTTPRGVPAEQGRYIFTALVPLTAITAGGCLAFGRRSGPVLAAALVAAVMGLGYASQLLELTSFFS